MMDCRPTKLITVLLALALGALSLSCKQLEDALGGERLGAGGEVVGPDNVRLSASDEGLDAPVPITLERVEPDLREFPEPLERVSGYYQISTDEMRLVRPGQWFKIAFDLPPGATDDLVVGFWMDPDVRYWADDAEDGVEPDTEGFWELVPGVVRDGRVEAHFYILPETPMTFALAQGEWFEGPFKEDEEIPTDVRRQELTGNLVNVICSRGSYGDCDQETRVRFRNAMMQVRQDFNDAGFEPPLIRDIEFDIPQMHLKGVRSRSLTRWTKLCNYDEEGSMLRGRYNFFTNRAVTCIWNRPRRAPQFVISDVSAGAKFTIQIEGKSHTATATMSDTPQTIAQELAENFDMASVANMSKHVRAIDDRVVFQGGGEHREWTYTTSTTGGGTIETLEYDHRTDLVGRHEYFHGVQFGSGLSGNIGAPTFVPLFLEGTAVASQESQETMVRDVYRSPRRIDIEHYDPSKGEGILGGQWQAGQDHYAGQDFYVFIGRELGQGIEWLTEIMTSRRYGGVKDVLEANGLEPSTVFWRYLKNQFYEAFEPLDFAHEPCDARAFVSGSSQHRTLGLGANDDEVEASRSMSPLSAAIFEIDIASRSEDTVYRVAAAAPTRVRTAIYDEAAVDDAGNQICSSVGRDSYLVVVPAGQPRKIWVLAGLPFEDDGSNATVTVQEVDLAIEITSPARGARFNENRLVFANADYVAENLPAQVVWTIDSEEVGTQTVSEGTARVRLDTRACPATGYELGVSIIDAEGNKISDSVQVNVDQHPDQVGISFDSQVAWLAGNSIWLPYTSTDELALDLSGVFRHVVCDPEAMDPSFWSWSHPRAIVSQQDLGLTNDDFVDSSGRARNVPVTVAYKSSTRSVTVRPCSLFATQSTCPPRDVVESMNTRFAELYDEVQQLREAIDAMSYLEDKLDEIFEGEVPSPFPKPWDEIFAGFDQPGMPYVALNEMNTALEADTMVEFERRWSRVISMGFVSEDPAVPAFVSTMASLVEVHIDFYKPIDAGGQGGFYDMSYAATDFRYPAEIDALVPARAALHGALTAWLNGADATTRLDDAELLDTSIDAGMAAGAQAGIDLLDD